jgi:hypothetical protein
MMAVNVRKKDAKHCFSLKLLRIKRLIRFLIYPGYRYSISHLYQNCQNEPKWRFSKYIFFTSIFLVRTQHRNACKENLKMLHVGLGIEPEPHRVTGQNWRSSVAAEKNTRKPSNKKRKTNKLNRTKEARKRERENTVILNKKKTQGGLRKKTPRKS